MFTESDDNYSVAQSKSASEGGGSESESRKSSLDKPTSRFTSVPVAEPRPDADVTMTETPSGAAATPSRFTQTRVIEDAGVGLTPLPGTKGLNRNGFSKGQSHTWASSKSPGEGVQFFFQQGGPDFSKQGGPGGSLQKFSLEFHRVIQINKNIEK